MTADEIQAAIDRADNKRRELQQPPDLKPHANALIELPRAAEAYRKQIGEGLDGNPVAAVKAREILRELFCGEIRLVPGEAGTLWAKYHLQIIVLLHAGTYGSGGRI
jgi:hypothetical protein